MTTCYAFSVRTRLLLAASVLWCASCSQPADAPRDAERREPAKPRALVPQANATVFSVTVTPTKLFLRGKPIVQDQLQAQLEALAERSASATIALQADSTVPSERLAEVVKAIRAAGFATVETAIRPVP